MSIEPFGDVIFNNSLGKQHCVYVLFKTTKHVLQRNVAEAGRGRSTNSNEAVRTNIKELE